MAVPKRVCREVICSKESLVLKDDSTWSCLQPTLEGLEGYHRPLEWLDIWGKLKRESRESAVLVKDLMEKSLQRTAHRMFGEHVLTFFLPAAPP